MFDAKKLLDALVTASQAPAGSRSGSSGGGLGGGLGDVLSQLGGQGASGAGGLGGLLGAVLGQATQGLQGAAQRSGAGPALNDILGKLGGGQGAGDLAGRLRDLANQNQFATGGALGTLAGLFLGSKAGRGLAVDAAKVGGLALIGGLAYQAWQNYQQGKPVLDLPQAGSVEAPPAASPFGSTGDEAADQEHAILLLRAMIAAACADGTVDDAERAQIVGGLQQSGLEPGAANFLDEAFASPPGIEDLVAGTSSPEVAAEVYTAARLTIDPDTAEEQRFLTSLAQSLGLDEQLVAHIDAAAESAKVSA